jgi:hypothetical protein
MKAELDPHVVSTLQMEYNAIRQEIGDVANSMDANLNLAVSMVSGAVAVAAFFKESRVLYIIPSVIFIAMCIHLVKTAATNVRGAYCQVIQARLKLLIGSDSVVLDWEGGEMFQHIAGPTGIVQIGLYLFFAGISGIFLVVAVLAYQWRAWTAYVHTAEFVTLFVYAILAIKWNTLSRRKDFVSLYLNKAEVSTQNRPTPKAQR